MLAEYLDEQINWVLTNIYRKHLVNVQQTIFPKHLLGMDAPFTRIIIYIFLNIKNSYETFVFSHQVNCMKVRVLSFNKVSQTSSSMYRQFEKRFVLRALLFRQNVSDIILESYINNNIYKELIMYNVHIYELYLHPQRHNNKNANYYYKYC